MKIRKLLKNLFIVTASILLLLYGDYFLYPLMPGGNGVVLNRGANGIWMRYKWYFGEKTEAETRETARRLAEDGIGYAFFHVRFIKEDGTLRFRYPESGMELNRIFQQEAPGIKRIAWIFAGNRESMGPVVDISSPEIRKAMISEAVWLTEEAGFDGVQWDYEICRDGDADFLLLLEETRAALAEGVFLGAAVPVLNPAGRGSRFGWSAEYYGEVAARVDQLAVMIYDTGAVLPRAYSWLVKKQVEWVTAAVADSGAAAKALFGLPTYGEGLLSHNPHSENISIALRGVRRGLASSKTSRNVFEGVSIFAEYTTDENEWKTYRKLWPR